MRISKNFFLLTVLILSSLIFSSCISINRNISVNKDGSGSEIMTIKFNKMFYEMMASMSSLMDSTRRQGYLDSLYSDKIFVDKTKEKYDSTQGIKLIDIYSFKDPDSSNSFVIKYEFDSLVKIGSSLDNINSSGDTSDKTNVTYNKEGNDILFNYIYEESMPQGAQTNDSLTAEMRKGMSELFKGGNFTFEIQFPYEVISSNAKSSEGNKLMWDFSISDMMSTGKMKLEAILKDN